MVAFISPSRFHPSLTGLAVHAGEDCIAMAEITWSLQVDLVLSDAAATVSYNLFNWSSVILHTDYGDAAMWLKSIQHPKMQYLHKILQ